MSWKTSTLWAFAVIAVIAAIFIIFPEMRNNFSNETLQQSAPRYQSHIIKGDIYLQDQPLKSATLMFYKQDNLNEVVVDRGFKDGKYSIDISYLSSGWKPGEIGIIEIQVGSQIFTASIVITKEPIQIQNIVIYS